MAATPAPATRRASIPALTGLRFVAAFYVVVGHFGQIIPYPPGLSQALGHGPAAVSLFFVLSGFVLTYNYFEWFAADCRRVRAFIWARFARIFPMHLVALLVMTPVSLLIVDFSFMGLTFTAEQRAWSWLANLLLLHAHIPVSAMHILWNTPSWSVSDEAFFYGLFPVFVRHVLSQARSLRSLLRLGLRLYLLEAAVVVVATLALHVINTYRLTGEPYAASFWFTAPVIRVWEFLLGCVIGAAWLQHQAGQPAPPSGLFSSIRGRNAVLGGVLVALPLVIGLLSIDPLEQLRLLSGYLFYTPLFVLLVAALAHGPSFLTPLLEHPVVIRLGEASYSLYLIHWIPLAVLVGRARLGAAPEPWLSLLVMGATVLLSIGCYQAIERPTRRLLLRGSWRAKANLSTA